MRRHFSQSIGAGAFDGQHGMSFAMSSAVATISCDTAAIAPADGDSAMTGRDSGANARPATIKIAIKRRMVGWRTIPKNPTKAPELKAFQVDDAVMSENEIDPNSYRETVARAFRTNW